MSEFAEWESFYVIVGGAAAALISLQFVVLTLIAAFTPALLPYVFLYRFRIALVRFGRIAPVLAQRAPLPQEIPVAIELDLHLAEALLLLIA
jgi:hypothetical protein